MEIKRGDDRNKIRSLIFVSLYHTSNYGLSGKLHKPGD
jgi:hypothetical protein